MTAHTTDETQSDRQPLVSQQDIANFAARYGIFLVLALMVAVISVLTPVIRGEQYFLTPRNLIQVMLQGAVNAIIAVGMTFIITSGGIDLSVGSMLALCGVLAALAMRDLNVGAWGGLLVCLGVGTLCGLFNGVLIIGIRIKRRTALRSIAGVNIALCAISLNQMGSLTLTAAGGLLALLLAVEALTITLPRLTTFSLIRATMIALSLSWLLASMALMALIGAGVATFFISLLLIALLNLVLYGFLVADLRLPPFIATLGTLGIFRGLALIISDGRPIYGFGREFLQTFSGNVVSFGDVGLPVAVVIALLVALIGWFIFTRTRFGKYTIAIGGNEETARLAGIRVERYKLGIYAFGGLLTGLAAALLLARLSSGDPTFGTLAELDAIAAAVMGGTSLTGGEGSVSGTLVGAVIISLVRNAMNLFNLPSYYQQVVIGAVIVLAVMLDQWRKGQTQKN